MNYSTYSELFSLIKNKWDLLSDEERKIYTDQAREESLKFEKEYEDAHMKINELRKKIHTIKYSDEN
jgi:hypothetical protein